MGNMRAAIVVCVLALLATAAAAQDRPKPYRSDDLGITAPVATKRVHAAYTREALEARIQGTVAMDAVVLDNGSVSDVTITTSLDDGLDKQAVKAMKQWEFKPGTKNGKPVAVVVSVTMSFTLK